MGRCVVGIQDLGQLAVVVLHAMPLIDNHVLPAQLGQQSLVLHDVLIGSDEHVELAALQQGLGSTAVVGRTFVCNLLDVWCPFLHLHHPVGDGGEWHNDEEGAVDSLVLHQVADQSDGLDGFAQTHLVSQDSVQVVVVEGHHPFQPTHLVLLQLATHQHGRLLQDLLSGAVCNAIIVLASSSLGCLVLIILFRGFPAGEQDTGDRRLLKVSTYQVNEARDLLDKFFDILLSFFVIGR